VSARISISVWSLPPIVSWKLLNFKSFTRSEARDCGGRADALDDEGRELWASSVLETPSNSILEEPAQPTSNGLMMFSAPNSDISSMLNREVVAGVVDVERISRASCVSGWSAPRTVSNISTLLQCRRGVKAYAKYINRD
jgi:hypothetical protein